VAPVWFVWQEGRALVMTGGSSVKVRNLRGNPSVTLSVASDTRPYQYVSLEGEANLTQDNMAELVHRICTRYDGPEQGAAYAQELLEHGNMVVIDVQVKRIVSWKQDD
jgi:PPOX class probable F420-dependent enzyme